MKKLLICLLTVITAFSMDAQEKVTKLNVIGNWNIVSMELPGTVYYNLEIDSLAPREALLAQIGSGKDSTDALATMKTSLAMLKGMSFIFNADGKGEITDGMNPAKDITYSVDEAGAVITTVTLENDAKEDLKASFVKELLRMEFEDTENHIVFLFRKAK